MICETGTDTGKAAEWLRKGYTVGIPTETVYGLAANALNEEAVLEIFRIKERPVFDPLIVHVKDAKAVDEIAVAGESERRLMELFWPGPLTILLPKKAIIPDLVTSGLPTVGVRMPSHPVTLKLLETLPFPLAAPSANPFGYISPTTAQHVKDQLGTKIPYILDGGASDVGVESTIVSVDGNKLKVHRKGGVTTEALSEAGFQVEYAITNEALPVAPGMLESHYAPFKPLYFGTASQILNRTYTSPVAVICMNEKELPELPGDYVTFSLSLNNDLGESARSLFDCMRKLDEGDYNTILAIEFPHYGLGHAINDRLRRASVKRTI